MQNLKAIIFDFDGVICESVEVKTEAFKKLFLKYPRNLNQIINFHIANGGVSRFKKFEIIYRDIIKKEFTEEISSELGKKFSEYVYDGVLNSKFVTGAYEFLEKYHKKFLLFVASGTPYEELRSIVHNRGLKDFFRGVYGSPMMKGEIIKKILTENCIDNDAVFFVGDSTTDYEGAKEAGIPFVGRILEKYPDIFTHLNVKTKITDFLDLERHIQLQAMGIHNEY